MSTNSRDRQRRGSTVVELVVALTLLSLIFALGGLISATSENVYEQASVSVQRVRNSARIVDRIAEDLATVSESSLFPIPEGNFGSTFLYYRKVDDLVDGQIVWGSWSLVFLTYDQGEWNDGQDNDGDGLVDECQVIHWRNIFSPNQMMMVLADDVGEYLEGEVPNGLDDNGNGLVDENGLSFHLNGDVMTVRMSFESQERSGELVQSTVERPFQIRN